MDKEIEILVTEIIEKTIKAVNEESKTKEKKRYYAITFRYMKNYNSMKRSLENSKDDNMNHLLNEIKTSRVKTVVILDNIDSSLEIIRKELEDKGQLVKYEAFEMYFIQNKSYEYIAATLVTGESTPRRWITEVVSMLSVKLFGIEAI